MKHSYIFDYSTADIYHTKLSDDIAESDKKIESYLSNTLGFKLSNIHYMVTESELGIIEIKL